MGQKQFGDRRIYYRWGQQALTSGEVTYRLDGVCCRYAMGLRVCAQHNACPDAAAPVTLGVATLPLCERHAAQHRGDMMRFNPAVEES